MEEKPKMNWWVDIGLFLAAPLLAALAASAGGNEDTIASIVLLLPVLTGFPLGYRVSVRAAKTQTTRALMTILLGGGFSFLLVILSMFGCSLGGGGFNLH